MSTLEAGLDRIEGVLGRMMTALEGEGFGARELETLAGCYDQADSDLNGLLQGVSTLPVHMKLKVARVHSIHRLVQHMMQGELDAVTERIAKAQATRRALGQTSHAEFVGFGSTGIDCNLQG